MWTELYGGTAQDVADALDSGPLVLSGLPGACRAELLRELSGNGPVVEMQPRHAGTPAGLKVDLLNSLLDESAASAGATTERDFRVLVATIFGRRAQDVLDIATGGDATGLSMAEILAGLSAGATLIVHDAHLLPALSDSALWAIRARAQAASPPRVALLTRSWHHGALVGPEGAFFGLARALDLPRPSFREWGAVAGSEVGEDELRWLLDMTRGHARVTLAVLERVQAGDANVPWAWNIHVHESEPVAREVGRLAFGLHAYAPRLLTAIAAGGRVYKSVPEARTDAIAAALRLMRDHDLIYQPRPRQWLLADPALEPHLASGPV